MSKKSLRENIKNWDSIYGDDPEEKIVLTKPVKYYIESINNIIVHDKTKLLYYFPHICAFEKLNRKYNIKSVLEIGCGSGLYSYTICRYFDNKINFYLLDFSSNALYEAKKLFQGSKDATFIKSDAFDLPFKDKSIDVCITGGLIEHFGKSQQLDLLKEIKRVSMNQIHQYPIDNLFYWAQRSVISFFNSGKWPFGFEVPVDCKREALLFNNAEEILKSYPLLRLEFRFFTNKNNIMYFILRKLNQYNIYRYFHTERVAFEGSN